MFPQFIDVYMAPVRDNPIVQAALFAVLILILADMLLGIINACAQGKFSSKELRAGLLHKTGELGIILVGIIIDGLIFAGLDLGFNGPILITMLSAIIIMEVGSVLEISAHMNPTLAKFKIFNMLASVDGSVKEE